VDNTRDYARVSHSRQWSNYNITVVTIIRTDGGVMDAECRGQGQGQGQ